MRQYYLLAIDQGTTNNRAIIFNHAGNIISQHEIGLSQTYPKNGWVEQNANEIFDSTLTCCRYALKNANLDAKQIAAIGISNQRETTIIWDRISGEPIYPAIVWQDRRTHDLCKSLSQTPLQKMIYDKTGLLLDPYFSATKITWILDNIKDARKRAERGELLFGTIDTYLLWKLTQGQSHATDATNASRTLLFNIHTQQWDDELLIKFNVPRSLLPTVLDNTANFGDTAAEFLGHSIPIAGMAGDQQAAAIGQACFQSGTIKATYGTGCFMLLNTGHRIIQSNHNLLSTIAYRIQNKVTYALEGSIFSAGATINWLCHQLQLITNPTEAEQLAACISDTDGVYFVPAFTGLGAPYWDPEVRAAITGINSHSKKEHIVRAALESVAYQTRDLLEAMQNDSNTIIKNLRVDGGMTVNNWLLQFIADILDIKIDRPICIETTALGAAYLAGLQMGIYESLEDISKHWQMAESFRPHMQPMQRESLYSGWKKAVECCISSR